MDAITLERLTIGFLASIIVFGYMMGRYYKAANEIIVSHAKSKARSQLAAMGKLRRDAVLAEKVASHYTIAQLKILCAHLDVRFENIPGETLKIKAIEIVSHFRHSGRLNELIEKLSTDRPRTFWHW